MDKVSFLNAVHSQFVEDMYLQYQKYPDSVEPSWKSFFQGFDFALENYGEETAVSQYAQQAVSTGNVHEDILTEFKVVNLIEAYRTRGHLFTKTNPVRDRRQYYPTLDIENFGLTQADLPKKFNSSKELGFNQPMTLEDIVKHLKKVYCDSIGIEYMHISNVEEKNFIREWINQNENHPQLSVEEKKEILHKLN